MNQSGRNNSAVTNEGKGGETRAGLLAAAERILIEQGIQALTVRRIGAVSGLAPTLVTYHFGTITALLAKLCRHNLEPMLEAWKPLGSIRFTDLRELLRVWMEPLLLPSAFTPGGRALVILDEIASHGDPAFRDEMLRQLVEISVLVQQALQPLVPHLSAVELRARVRFLSAATLGPPPRNRQLTASEMSPPLDGIDYLLDFAVAALSQ